MRHEPFEVRCIDLQSLNPAQRGALKQHLIRRAHKARAEEIRRTFVRAVGLLARLPAVGARKVRGAIGEFLNACARRHDHWQDVARLRAMTDYELRDIGLTRGQIRAAVFSDEPDATLRDGGRR